MVDEAALLASVAAGTPDWAGIYEAYGDDMTRVATFVLGRRSIGGDDAEDVVTKSLTELIRRGLPADVQNLRAYLLKVVHRRAIDVSRRERFDDPLETLEAEADDVAELAMRAIDRERVLEALEQLDPKTRHAVRERYMNQRPAKDVAAEIDVTPQYLPKLIRKGLAQIRAAAGFIQEVTDDRQTHRSPSSEDKGATQ